MIELMFLYGKTENMEIYDKKKPQFSVTTINHNQPKTKPHDRDQRVLTYFINMFTMS